VHVLVVTVVHTPLDARIWHRQIGALLDAGHKVTYVAPFSGYGTAPPDGVVAVDVPRSTGRRRVAAVRAARRSMKRYAGAADVIVLHDPELLAAAAFLRRPPTVWDVHEDTAADLVDKPWLPRPVRGGLRPVVRGAERLAERRVHLLLAEEGYQPSFRRPHVVVPNEPVVPATVAAPGNDRVVYLGRVSRSRGADLLLALPGRLPRGVRLEVLGPADTDVEARFADAARAGVLDWSGFVPNDVAHARLDGALAGVSLLRDLPNFRHSRPTKVVEYMARGVPVITTPTPVAAEIVQRHDSGMVVPFDDLDAVATAIERLHRDESLRNDLARRGHDAALAHYDWRRSAARFVAELERIASPSPRV
jgi:glycosyltransferase involved in cell wall biosynthesis